jgi:hypothetical protein
MAVRDKGERALGTCISCVRLMFNQFAMIVSELHCFLTIPAF